MTPMLGLSLEDNGDLINSKERWMSPEKKVKPGDCKHLSQIGDKNEYMHKLMCARKSSLQQQDEDNVYKFRQTTSIPETPMQNTDNDRKITAMKTTTASTALSSYSIHANNSITSSSNNNSSTTVKDKLKNLL